MLKTQVSSQSHPQVPRTLFSLDQKTKNASSGEVRHGSPSFARLSVVSTTVKPVLSRPHIKRTAV